MKTDDETTRAKTLCDEPHFAEVIATGPRLCPVGLAANEFTALVSQYVGVGYSPTPDWMNEQGLTGMGVVNFEEGRLAGTMCYLLAEEGDLTRSYRSD